jgi:hypothetical protein
MENIDDNRMKKIINWSKTTERFKLLENKPVVSSAFNLDEDSEDETNESANQNARQQKSVHKK